MRAFVKEILSAADMELGQLAGGYKYSVFGDRAVCVEGHSGLAALDSCSVKLRIKNKFLLIKGERLTVKQLTNHSAVVVGSVQSVTVE